MPTLVQIDSCLGVGSTGHITESIADLATKDGWDCYIAHGARYVGKSKYKSIQITNKFEEYLHYALGLITDGHGLFSTIATKKFVKKMKDMKPDVFQLHCIHGYYLNFKVLFKYFKESRIPVVWTQHDCWAFTGHCSNFSSANCLKWQTKCCDCPLYKSYPKSIVDKSARNFRIKKRLFASLDNITIVSVSYWLDSMIAKSFLNIYNHIVIYNGIDTSVFKPTLSSIREKYGIKDSKYILGAATTWSDTKGLSDYIQLLPILPVGYKIVLVGISKELAETLPDEIICIPRTVDKLELCQLYSEATLVTSLSYQEAMGLIPVEGMACGTPSIVYDNTAQSEIASGGTGFVVKTGDVSAVKDAILSYESLLQEEKSEMRRKCLIIANESFDKDKQFSNYIVVYNNLIINN